MGVIFCGINRLVLIVVSLLGRVVKCRFCGIMLCWRVRIVFISFSVLVVDWVWLKLVFIDVSV